MCGIIGYIGKKEARNILLDGLETLEYRGYDSAGAFLAKEGAFKAVGPVKNLRGKMAKGMRGTSGIAHTRWATHGKPSEANAHPHTGKGKVWVVHNGIIENYQELRQELSSHGSHFSSETDTEAIPRLIERAIDSGLSFEEAVLDTLPRLRGTYGLAIMHADAPEKIIAARMGSPLIIGVAPDGRFVASDAAPLIRHTRDVVYMKDGDVALLTKDSHEVFSVQRQAIARKNESLEQDFGVADKMGYEHFMEKEIMEAPEVLRSVIRGRIVATEGRVKLGGLEASEQRLREADRIILVGCGTSYYAAMVGTYLIEDLARVPVQAEIGSELRYRNPVFTAKTVLVALSQSGETADTLEAVRDAKRQGAFTIGIVNVVGSSIARETDVGIYNHAGLEVSVASTKAFISQVAALVLLAVFLGQDRGLSLASRKSILSELECIPDKISSILKTKASIRALAIRFAERDNMLFIGRRYMLPLAYEGALKLKEVSYVHAEAYGAGELKHGPLSLIDDSFPVVVLAPKDSVYSKTVSNIREIQARGGEIIGIGTEGFMDFEGSRENHIEIPETLEMLSPLLAAISLQLFAYYIAVARGVNVDRPRNLAKSVTVE